MSGMKVSRGLSACNASLVLVLGLLCQTMPAAEAQLFPNKPLRFIVPFAPGGGASTLARTVGDQLAKEIGQPVLVVNRDGAGTVIGYNEVAKAPADGYSLLLSGNAGAINAASGRDLPYDLQKDLEPVTIIYAGAQVMLGGKDSRFNTLRELVAWGKANPGQVKFGSNGTGSSVHFSSEQFNQAAGIKALHVPYKGANPAMQDLAGGRIDYVIAGSSGAFPAVKSGQFKGLAILSRTRSRQMPDLPTAIEQGVNVETEGWYGIHVRAGAPAQSVRTLHAALMKILGMADMGEKLAAMGGEPRTMSQSEFRTFIQGEIDTLSRLVRILDIKVAD